MTQGKCCPPKADIASQVQGVTAYRDIDLAAEATIGTGADVGKTGP